MFLLQEKAQRKDKLILLKRESYIVFLPSGYFALRKERKGDSKNKMNINLPYQIKKLHPVTYTTAF